jgi:hypothetical protein
VTEIRLKNLHECRAFDCNSWCAVQIVKTLTEQVSKYAQIVLDSCAYAGTGNVLKVQELLGLCGEHIETEEATAWKVSAGDTLTC